MYQLTLPSIAPAYIPANGEHCIDRIYDLCIEGYESHDLDIMQCVLNEIARQCAEFYQLTDSANE